MPKIRRRNLPQPLLDHLWHRVRDRQISADNSHCWLIGWIRTQKFRRDLGSNDSRKCLFVAKVNSSKHFFEWASCLLGRNSNNNTECQVRLAAGPAMRLTRRIISGKESPRMTVLHESSSSLARPHASHAEAFRAAESALENLITLISLIGLWLGTGQRARK
jgi:hypothetical protein